MSGWLYRAILVLGTLVSGMFLFLAHRASAHDWYPGFCCSGMDCAPVDKVEMVPAPYAATLFGSPAVAAPGQSMLVTTKHGTVIVPPNFQRRFESKDGAMHACMRPHPDGTMRLLCLFLPPAS